jgi:hypothetical protein
MKMRFAIMAVLMLGLTGCGVADRVVGGVTGYANICVKGVNYLQFTSGATVQVDRDGKPVAC